MIFLGGSCNPTTWRREIAIPFLEEEGLSYYNPQVTEWSSQLIIQENEAKEKAEVLFYVLDNQTRSTVAMLEVAYSLGQGLPIVLVVNPYVWPGAVIAGEAISKKEYEDLQKCQNWLCDLSRRHGVHVYTDILEALRDTAKRIRSGDLAKYPYGITTSRNSHKVQDKSDKSHLRSLSSGRSHTNDRSSPGSVSCGSGRRIPNHGRRKEKVLLFYISCHQRSLIEMISTAYFLGNGKRCIICIRELPPKASIDGEALSADAIKDYNRCRSYLADFAHQCGYAEVFSSIKEAVKRYLCLQVHVSTPSEPNQSNNQSYDRLPSLVHSYKHETFGVEVED